MQLAAAPRRWTTLSLLSRPICRRLAETVHETVNVAVHDGHAVISIDQVLGSPTITTTTGRRRALHATSSGKVFLAHMDPEQLDALLAEGLESFTPNTIVDPAVLKQELALVRERATPPRWRRTRSAGRGRGTHPHPRRRG